MQLAKQTKRLIAGAVALVAIPVLGIGIATSAQATNCGSDSGGDNVTVVKGAYQADFCAYGEELHIFDRDTDGDAAVAYVKVYDWIPRQGWYLEDSDRFVVSNGYDMKNLGTPDGSGNIDENQKVSIMICRGYASAPGDNCSPWESGLS